MHILHIVNDYNHTKVHKNLISSIDKMNFSQLIFVPLKSESNIGKNEFLFENSFSRIIYSDKIKKHHRLFFRTKINFLFNNLTKNVEMSNVDLIHASTLYSDGALAYRLYCEFGTPYIVTIRNTDLFTFYKIRKDLFFIAKRILDNASKIVFISEANKNYFFSLNWSNSMEFLNKSIVLNNGIDEYWLNNIVPYVKRNNVVLNALYIGRFDNNKNVLNLIKSLDKFNSANTIKIRLKLVGGNGQQHDQVLNLTKKNNWIEYLGHIDNKEDLMNVFRSSDFFIMISKKETFGLVYVESLSQGLPVIFTKNQGIDGMTNLQIGEATGLTENELLLALNEIASKDYSDINKLSFSDFDWSNIAEKYTSIYNSLKHEKS